MSPALERCQVKGTDFGVGRLTQCEHAVKGEKRESPHLNWNEEDGLGYDDLVIVADESQNKEGSPMIRGVLQDGLIRPIDHLPPDWAEGRMVVVEDAESASPDDLDEWYQELKRLGAAQYDPGERDQIRAIMAEADAQAKELVRREMGSR
jgi:hypothetical protein